MGKLVRSADLQLGIAQLHQVRYLTGQDAGQLLRLETASQGATDCLHHAWIVVPAAIKDLVHQMLHLRPRPVKGQSHQQCQPGDDHCLEQHVARQETVEQQERPQENSKDAQ